MFYKILLCLIDCTCINMIFRTTETSAFAGGLIWSSCSCLEGQKVFVPAAVQVRAVNTVLKVNLFLEFVHLLRNFLSQHLLTCNTDWNILSVSKAHP